MTRHDQELLDKQLWGVSSRSPQNGMAILMIVAVFLAGVGIGDIVSKTKQHCEQPLHTAYRGQPHHDTAEHHGLRLVIAAADHSGAIEERHAVNAANRSHVVAAELARTAKECAVQFHRTLPSDPREGSAARGRLGA